MTEFYVRELRSNRNYKVLSVIREDYKTLFLVWKGNHFSWLDARKVEYVDDTHIGG